MVRRMTNWGVTKTNNDRNLLRYSHTYSNGWFTYHVFFTITTYFKTNGSEYLWWLCHIFWTQSDVGKGNQRQKWNTRPFITLQFSTDLQVFSIRQFQRYISSQQSERDLQIFLQFLDLASHWDTSWSISRSKPWWSRCDRVFSGSGILWSNFPLIARDI